MLASRGITGPAPSTEVTSCEADLQPATKLTARKAEPRGGDRGRFADRSCVTCGGCLNSSPVGFCPAVVLVLDSNVCE
jgi:hypothetical protein